VAEAALAHGKFAGTVAGSDQIDEYVAMGYRFLSVGADVVALSQYCASLADAFAKRVEACGFGGVNCGDK
jgi:4-hydroxy-2-oxoheptanedioate aldolase